MKITHSMVLNEVTQGGDARRRVDELIDDSAQTPDQKEHLHERADEIFQTLFDTKVIETEERDDGGLDYFLDVDMPDDFALDQPLHARSCSPRWNCSTLNPTCTRLT